MDIQKSSLQDVMKKVTEENAANAQQEQEANTQQYYDFSSVPEAVRNTDWFKSLPYESKIQIAEGKMGTDPDLNDINEALGRDEAEILEKINERREENDKLAFTPEEFKSGQSEEIVMQEEEEDEVTDTPTQLDLDNGLDLDSDDEEEEEDDTPLTPKERLAKEIEDMQKGIDEMDKYVVKIESELTSHDNSATTITFKKNKDFESNVKSVLDANKIKFKTGKKGGLKKAVLNNFIHNSAHVTVPLINSGIYVTISGGSIPEIIGMSEIRSNSTYEIKRRYYEIVYKHVVDTSIGSKLTFQQFLSVVSHLDESTLFYGLYTATFPNEENEFLTECTNKKCGETVKVLFSPHDMVLNAEDFDSSSKYILYQNTDIKDVIKQSAIARERLVPLSNGAVIALLTPSLYDHLVKLKEAEELDETELTEKYQTVLNYISFVKYIALPDEDGHHISYNSIKEMAEILLHMDIEVLLNELGTALEESLESKIVEYGIKKFTCPKCQKDSQKQLVDITQYLFLSSQLRKMTADLQQMKLRYDRMK